MIFPTRGNSLAKFLWCFARRPREGWRLMTSVGPRNLAEGPDLAQHLLDGARDGGIQHLTVGSYQDAAEILQSIRRIVEACRHYGINLSAAASRVRITPLYFRSLWGKERS